MNNIQSFSNIFFIGVTKCFTILKFIGIRDLKVQCENEIRQTDIIKGETFNLSKKRENIHGITL